MISFLVFTLLLPLAPFLAAGRWDWAEAWVLYGLYVLVVIGSRAITLRLHPELIIERGQLGAGEGVKSWDKIMVPLAALAGPLATWVVAGLDRRWGWTPPLPTALPWGALVLVVLGYLWSTWAMLANTYFSAYVRIQKDRGQTVVTSGPYRVMRHPGYAGGILAGLAVPLVLGSLCALLPAALTAGVLILRTALEDRTLLAELPGYVAYARRTRYRLLPGVW